MHTHVREDQLALFGFATALELTVFERLIAVSGIGPKLALAVLSGIEPRELLSAIQRNDLARLTRIPGVGKKTAERIVIELRDRLPKAIEAAVPARRLRRPPMSCATIWFPRSRTSDTIGNRSTRCSMPTASGRGASSFEDACVAGATDHELRGAAKLTVLPMTDERLVTTGARRG